MKKNVSAKREHLRRVCNKDKLSQCSGLCGTHSIGTFFFFSIRPCGTELSSQIHLTLSTNHSLILLIVQSLAQLCIPGFQFSIIIRFSVPNPCRKKQIEQYKPLQPGDRESWAAPKSVLSKRQPLSILALSILAALLQNGQSLSTIYMYMTLGWTGFTCPRYNLYTSKWRDVRFNLRYIPTFHLFHGSHPHPFSQPAWQKSRQSW